MTHKAPLNDGQAEDQRLHAGDPKEQADKRTEEAETRRVRDLRKCVATVSLGWPIAADAIRAAFPDVNWEE